MKNQPMDARAPRLVIDLKKLRENAAHVVSICRAEGLSTAGVVKGISGIPECALQFVEAGCAYIASSRISQLARLKKAVRRDGSPLLREPAETMLIRTPMVSEVDDVVRYADVSVNSEKSVLEALSAAAARQGTVQRVILMADLGDIREGIYDEDELLETAAFVERDPALELTGVATNLGCLGAVLPTKEKLEEFAETARHVEHALGRKLDVVSTGGTSGLMRIFDGTFPPGMNNIRVGEGILLARDLEELYGCPQEGMHQDIFTLEAEIIEVKRKPSVPRGEIGFNAFGKKPVFEDLGIRVRALAAAGEADFGTPDDLVPIDPGVRIIGASSDHLALDVTDAEREFHPGDIVSFRMKYLAMVNAGEAPDVSHVFINDPDA